MSSSLRSDDLNFLGFLIFYDTMTIKIFRVKITAHYGLFLKERLIT